ncbi:hypothetical protein PoB_006548900 [Plakobranchus ocellatus]|uniref:Uncharacterized protein n=1 Tax=Plakobranchus ocellatus TaxID=259542 RepID=A0AAV4D4A7_9GAST|nr:hypothetical protein PoB_006548900 [Plakobranchus ocellatus]
MHLASRASLEKLDKAHNAVLRLLLGALRGILIAILELAAGCEPLSLRRAKQTILSQDRYLRTDEVRHSGLWQRNSQRNAAE